jgi:hypothetical protein
MWPIKLQELKLDLFWKAISFEELILYVLYMLYVFCMWPIYFTFHFFP